jgi:hypothetical protein
MIPNPQPLLGTFDKDDEDFVTFKQRALDFKNQKVVETFKNQRQSL